MKIFAYGTNLVLALVTSTASMAQTTVIHAGHLIAEPGGGAAADDMSIVIEKSKIVAIRAGYVPGDRVIDLRDSWVMPGLIDMHTHVTDVLNMEVPVAGQLALAKLRPPAEVVLAMLPRMKALLMGGFTTIRNLYDPSSTTYALRDAVETGAVAGPRIIAVETQIAVDSGDLDSSTNDLQPALEPFVRNRGNCTGVTECVKAVRSEVRRGADVIKLRQSGMAAIDEKIAMVETPEELHAIVDTAHRLNRRVAAHVVGSPTFLHAVIEAGADSIEHGPLDDASIVMMAKRRTSFTPTLLAEKLYLGDGKLLGYGFADVSARLGRAYRGGVRIVFGTDLGIFGPERSREEFELMAQAGMPPEQVLRAATFNAAEALGRVESLGSIRPGKLADVIAMREDPMKRIGSLGDASRVSFVMKAGEIYKDVRP